MKKHKQTRKIPDKRPIKRSSRQHLLGSTAGTLIEVAAHLILIDQAAPMGTIHTNKRNNHITRVPRKVESISDASGPPPLGPPADNGDRCFPDRGATRGRGRKRAVDAITKLLKGVIAGSPCRVGEHKRQARVSVTIVSKRAFPDPRRSRDSAQLLKSLTGFRGV